MNIDASNPILNTQSSSPRSSRFSQALLRENDFSLADWQPGAAPGQKPLDAFTRVQKEKLLQLRTALVNSIKRVAQDTRADTSDSTALATHNGDAGSDACDRDLALYLLSQEKDALIEIDEALERIESGSYGVCEMSGEPIPTSRLEAIPFARFTVKCQSEIEKQRKSFPERQSIPSLFSVADEEENNDEEVNRA